MSLHVRKATPDDALLFVRVVDMASDGVVSTLWSEMAPTGMDGSAVGRAPVEAEEVEFSYRNAFIAERDGAALGGMIGYVLPTAPQPVALSDSRYFEAVAET